MIASEPALTRRGLTEAEAQARAQRGQRNIAPAGGARSVWQIIRDNVFTVFNLILFATLASLLALGMTSPETRALVIADALTSGGTVWLNMLIGLIQELYAKHKLDRLAVLHAGAARVYRDGQVRRLPFDEIVVGDEIELQAGDRVPVDGSLLEARALEVNESLITGESESVRRVAGDMLLSGSFCVAGRGVMRAERVGAASYAGRLVLSARQHRDTLTPLQNALKLVIELLVVMMIIITVLQLAAALHSDLSALQTMRQVTVIVTSFVPSGLILSVTVSLSAGALRISRLNTLVQRINAIESMGHLTTLCVDKTGTLTENRLTVRAVLPLDGHPIEVVRNWLSHYAFSAASQNNTTTALAEFAGPPSDRRAVVAEIPFNSTRKWGAVSLAGRDGYDRPCTVIVGAPEVVLSPDSPYRQRVAQLAGDGLRVLALAAWPAALNGTAPADCSLDEIAPDRRPLALLAIEDPLRADIRDTVATFQRLGVRLVVISGDHEGTVRATAARAGLP
ncbi:MAG: HAD-IC family P-type ATPase, partial [Anaerolineae bacterium]|nr:HAD-IC family P-type ATPase [Thermoflexales bacterium]MDW8408211.1 HAD-IC family P-type ATPase [Anaerolineae bacterium]